MEVPSRFELQAIVNRHVKNLSIVEVDADYVKMTGWDMIDRHFCAGNDTIIMGSFKDRDKSLLVFYHELGHIVDARDEIWNLHTHISFEIHAWKTGMELAFKDGIIFPSDIIAWGFSLLMTYSENKELMDNCWVENPIP